MVCVWGDAKVDPGMTLGRSTTKNPRKGRTRGCGLSAGLPCRLDLIKGGCFGVEADPEIIWYCQPSDAIGLANFGCNSGIIELDTLR